MPGPFTFPVAEAVPFDNEENNFTAENTQEAIEEAKISGVPFNVINCGEFLSDRHYKAYSNAGGQVINNVDTPLILTQSTPTSDTNAFNLASGELQFLTAGKFYVTYNVTFDNTNNSRTNSRNALQINTGSGFVEIEDTVVYTYERQANADRQTGTGTALIDVNIGDIIRIVSRRIQGSNNTSLGSGTALMVVPQRERTEDQVILGIDGANVTDEELLFNYNAGEL